MFIINGKRVVKLISESLTIGILNNIMELKELKKNIANQKEAIAKVMDCL